MDPVSLQKIADLLGARLVLKAEQPKTLIRAIKPLHQAGDEDLSFLANPKYAQYLPQTRALAVLVHEEFLGQVPQHTHALVMKDPYLGFAKAAQLFAKPLNLPAGIHPTAVVGAHCQIDPSASIGPHVVLGEGVSIAARAMIGANTSLADGVVIGENTKIYPNVSIYRDVKIGKNGVIHSGVVLGSDGFGMARDESGWV
ncbi:MAG: UDP-3-O-(3-hydroxymyristoyl)glucosamine N-acyltransferase, partial [Gammaproteobacteria bacterium]|nr:UDP-3-O-(3-hydroxymyristoyl)glucosamine N-acyltransferase [Gammaproteobacteria bacterium]